MHKCIYVTCTMEPQGDSGHQQAGTSAIASSSGSDRNDESSTVQSNNLFNKFWKSIKKLLPSPRPKESSSTSEQLPLSSVDVETEEEETHSFPHGNKYQAGAVVQIYDSDITTSYIGCNIFNNPSQDVQDALKRQAAKLDKCLREKCSVNDVTKIVAPKLLEVIANDGHCTVASSLSTFSDLHISVKSNSFTAVAGHEGCGKTVLLMKLCMSLRKEEDFICFYVNVAKIPLDTSMSVKDFTMLVINCQSEDTAAQTTLFDWMKVNQGRCIFVIDECEKTVFWNQVLDILGDTSNVSFDDRLGVSDLLGYFCSGLLFPHAHIVISCSLCKLQTVLELPQQFQLYAVSLYDTQALFKTTCPQNADDHWQVMEKEFPLLSRNACFPHFCCQFSKYLFQDVEERNQAHQWLSAAVLSYPELCNIDMMLESVNKKLCLIAFNILQENRSSWVFDADIFYDNTLQRNFAHKFVCISSDCLPGALRFCFVHPAVLCCFAAMHVLMMELTEFELFTQKCLSGPESEYMMQLLFYLLFMKDDDIIPMLQKKRELRAGQIQTICTEDSEKVVKNLNNLPHSELPNDDDLPPALWFLREWKAGRFMPNAEKHHDSAKILMKKGGVDVNQSVTPWIYPVLQQISKKQCDKCNALPCECSSNATSTQDQDNSQMGNGNAQMTHSSTTDLNYGSARRMSGEPNPSTGNEDGSRENENTSMMRWCDQCNSRHCERPSTTPCTQNEGNTQMSNANPEQARSSSTDQTVGAVRFHEEPNPVPKVQATPLLSGNGPETNAPGHSRDEESSMLYIIHRNLDPIAETPPEATVFFCTRKSDGVKCAAKVMNKNCFRIAEKEKIILKKVGELENVVSYWGCFEEMGEKVIIMPLCGGNVHQWVQCRKYRGTKKYIQKCSDIQPINQIQGCFVDLDFLSYFPISTMEIFRQIVNGLSHLHKNNIVHRDLKPSNLLLNLTPSKEVQILLTDFGLSREVGQDKSAALTRPAGTDSFLAPEYCCDGDDDDSNSDDDDSNSDEDENIHDDTADGDENNGAADGDECDAGAAFHCSGGNESKIIPTPEADIYSLGLTAYYILTEGHHPHGTDRYAHRSKIKKKQNPKLEYLLPKYDGKRKRSELTDEQRITCCQLIRQMLQSEPEDRPKIDQIKRHPTFWSGKEKVEHVERVSEKVSTYQKKRSKKSNKEIDATGLNHYNKNLLEDVDVRTEPLERVEFEININCIPDFLRDNESCNSMKDLYRIVRKAKAHQCKMFQPEDLQKLHLVEGEEDWDKFLDLFFKEFPQYLMNSVMFLQQLKEQKQIEHEETPPDDEEVNNDGLEGSLSSLFDPTDEDADGSNAVNNNESGSV